MLQRTILVSALALATVGWSQETKRPAPTLKEEAIYLEYCPTTGEAALSVEAESESTIRHVQVRNAAGVRVLQLQSRAGHGLELSGFRIESYEARLETLLASCPEGMYEMVAGTSDGRVARGGAELSHVLATAPQITYPLDGAAGVPLANLTITWTTDPSASAYRIGLEQGDTDGLRAILPGSSGSFQVSPGVLVPGVETGLEISAIAANGNLTTVQLTFTPQ